MFWFNNKRSLSAQNQMISSDKRSLTKTTNCVILRAADSKMGQYKALDLVKVLLVMGLLVFFREKKKEI